MGACPARPVVFLGARPGCSVTPSGSGLSHPLLQSSEPNGVYDSVCCRFSTSAPSAAARQGWAPGVTAAPLHGVPFTPGRLSGAVGSRRVPWPGRSAPSFHSSSSHRSAAKATHLSADPDSQFLRATSAHALLPGCSLPPLPRPPGDSTNPRVRPQLSHHARPPPASWRLRI